MPAWPHDPAQPPHRPPDTHFSWAKSSSCTRRSYLRLVSSTRVFSKGVVPLPGRACTNSSHSAVLRAFSGSIRSSSLVMFCGDQNPWSWSQSSSLLPLQGLHGTEEAAVLPGEPAHKERPPNSGKVGCDSQE